ncbi:pseudouridine synthase [Kordia zhangzhouensis]|uniref:pseudouridine synthase n=1 Tax=Kordia zhangzhouensis TaxID=1620405 RepID=UPI0006293792|nr:pseudouridine synthase [Kordia zhangzhouensis]
MILYEDAYILALYKPNNMLVHHSYMAKNQAEEMTLLESFQQKYQRKVFPLHRLDRKTSGLVLCAKDTTYVATFQQLFTSSTIEKVYYGLVRGFTPKQGEINSPVKGRDANVYKEAFTFYKTLQCVSLSIPVPPYETSRYSLIAMIPKTGRMHQLRIHMNKINHPLIGDPKYGDRFHNRMFQTNFEIDTLFLHAASLVFTHPYSQKQIEIKCPFPQHWQDIAKKFNWTLPS